MLPRRLRSFAESLENNAKKGRTRRVLRDFPAVLLFTMQAFMDVEQVATQIVDAAILVHRSLGPGLLESAYQQCLAYELRRRGMEVETEVILPIKFREAHVDVGYRVDMIIEKCVLIENKVVERVQPIHLAQLLTYLKLGDYMLGFLLNWNVLLMKNGIRRVVYRLSPTKGSEPKTFS